MSSLASAVESAVGKIRLVNSNTRTLALNARIEAARAGQHGAAFGVVASEMQDLSTRTTEVAELLATTTNVKINELLGLIGNNIRGTRLSDLALTNNSMLHLADFSRVLSEKKGYFVADYQGRPCCIAHAKAPGFETYSTDWYSLIIQPC